MPARASALRGVGVKPPLGFGVKPRYIILSARRSEECRAYFILFLELLRDRLRGSLACAHRQNYGRRTGHGVSAGVYVLA